jgi:hypothetical protein
MYFRFHVHINRLLSWLITGMCGAIMRRISQFTQETTMTATEPRKTTQAAPKPEPPKPLLTELTEKMVIASLGKPADLHSISVHRYDSRRCRVNVRRNLTKAAAIEYFRTQRAKEEDYKRIVDGADHAISRTITVITDSFYLRTNYDGSLSSGNTPIERKY